MTLTILDPTDERKPVNRMLAQRSGKIHGSVAMLDISKPRGNILLDQLEATFKSRLPDVTINRYAKPTFAKPAPEALRAEIQQHNDFVIEGLAD